MKSCDTTTNSSDQVNINISTLATQPYTVCHIFGICSVCTYKYIYVHTVIVSTCCTAKKQCLASSSHSFDLTLALNSSFTCSYVCRKLPYACLVNNKNLFADNICLYNVSNDATFRYNFWSTNNLEK